MVGNIKEITLWDNEEYRKGRPRPVIIRFSFPVSYTLLELEDLRNILRNWIKGEEEKYPQEQGFQGRWLLFNDIKKVNCPQMKCAFNIVGGCRECKQCKCEPNVIDEDCDVCWNCANDEGIIRWDDESLSKDIKEKEIIKPMEIIAK